MTDLTQQKTAPNAVTSLILGICSIVFGCFFIGLICGIIGLVMANNGTKTYNENPSAYAGEGMLKAGKITSIIGIVLGGLYVAYYIVAVAILGSAGFNLWSVLG